MWKDQVEYEQRRNENPKFRRLPTSHDIAAIIEQYDLLSLENASMFCRRLNANKLYEYFQVLCILLTVFLEIVTIEKTRGKNLYFIEICQIVLQVLFMLDVFVRWHAQYPNWRHFFNDAWNSSDFVLMLITMIPVVTYGLVNESLEEYFGLLRILRVLRILRLLNWIHDLNVRENILVMYLAIFCSYLCMDFLSFRSFCEP